MCSLRTSKTSADRLGMSGPPNPGPRPRAAGRAPELPLSPLLAVRDGLQPHVDGQVQPDVINYDAPRRPTSRPASRTPYFWVVGSG
jgi:hypothetical protein